MDDTLTGAPSPSTATDLDRLGSPFSPGYLGRLALALNARDVLTPEDVFDAFVDWTVDTNLEMWDHQVDACLGIAAGNHVILGTPTGSGKSLVATFMQFLSLAMGLRSYYTAPIKALVSEKFFNMVHLFGRDNVGMITGDAAINSDAPIICCTAEILANDALRLGAAADIDYVAMDEFHFFGEPDRGWAWQVPLLTLPNTRFLLMSATLGDMTAIVELLERQTNRSVDVVDNAQRPVPLSYQYVETPLESTIELALRQGDAPIYIVHFSQDAALTSAQSLISFGLIDKEQRAELREAIKGTRFTTAFGKTLKRLLEAGIGVHHAGMLPRYRLLVEKLAQQGLLSVICGTDTLGVGINVPIHTVVLTALSKYDGRRMRKLRAREFHQIAGRAGRSGFDTEGMIIAEAPEHDIENARALAKAGDDPKKIRKIRKKQPPEGFVSWSKQTFDRLVEAPPETLTPRMRVTHSMVLAEVVQGGDAAARVRKLIADSIQTDVQKIALNSRADEIFATLIDAGVVVKTEEPDGSVSYATTVDVPEDFALDQPLSPFMLAAFELLDPESHTYALDLISMVEATLEDPRQILRMQERKAKDAAVAAMKAAGIEYEERMERLEDVTYPKPLEELLVPAFAQYCHAVPWANDFELAPKSILRDMVETASNFKEYVGRYGISRCEGLLLRYLSDAYRVLDRTVPLDKRDERLWEIIGWLRLVVRSVDSSLVDEWESSQWDDAEDVNAPGDTERVVHDERAVRLLVRNALIQRVSLAAQDKALELGELDEAWGYGERAWRQTLDDYYAEHDEVLLDGDARSTSYFELDTSREQPDHTWHVRQTFKDEEDSRDFFIDADVDLDATQEAGEAVFLNYQVGFFEDLAR